MYAYSEGEGESVHHPLQRVFQKCSLCLWSPMACCKCYTSGMCRIAVSRMKIAKPMYPNNYEYHGQIQSIDRGSGPPSHSL